MLLSEFDYELPPELIAQEPPAERGSSRMLVLDRARGVWEDRAFRDFPAYLQPGDSTTFEMLTIDYSVATPGIYTWDYTVYGDVLSDVQGYTPSGDTPLASGTFAYPSSS